MWGIHRYVGRFLWSRLSILLVIPNLLFGLLALSTDARPLILVLGAAQIALAVSVCLAYFMPTFEIVISHRPVRDIDTAEVLILGIFLSWFSIVLGAGLTLAWRLAGQPTSWLNTDYTNYRIFMSCIAAALHLAAPHVVGHHVPPARWIKIGVLVGVVIFLAIMVGYLLDSQILQGASELSGQRAV